MCIRDRSLGWQEVSDVVTLVPLPPFFNAADLIQGLFQIPERHTEGKYIRVKMELLLFM